MRVKDFAMDERIQTYSENQRDKLLTLTSKIEGLNELFDIMVELENFFISNIIYELNRLLLLRSQNENMTRDVYLDEFKKYASQLNEKIDNLIVKWDSMYIRAGYTIDNIKMIIESMKECVHILSPIKNFTKSETVDILVNLINEFGYFRIYKTISSDNIIERLNILITLKNEIERCGIKKPRKKLTIDDI